LIIGCDYHPSFQQIAFVDTSSGELSERRLFHREEAEQFYGKLKEQSVPVRVGMEASGHARWFERMLRDLQFELWIGNAAEIRAKRVRRQKTDRQERNCYCDCSWKTASRGSGWRTPRIGICGNCCGIDTV
jgi:transposase